MNADLILVNLHAVTFGRGVVSAEMIAIRGNEIFYVGTADALGRLQGPHTRVLDCGGGLVVPGFNDAHCHALAFAITRQYADCSRARSVAEVQAVLREKIRETEGDQWLRAANCDFSAIAEGRAPNRQELDDAVSHLPVLLLERSGQTCVLNSLALELCGITADTPDSPSGGRIHRDPVTGLPDGVISGNNELVARAVPPPSEREIEAGMRKANREYLSLGITSLQDTSWSNGYRHWLAMKSFKERGMLAPRLTLLPGIDSMEEFVERGMKTGSGDGQLRVGAVKIALDESTGDSCPPKEELNDAALGAHSAGFQLAFHVPDVHLLQTSMQALEYVRNHSTSGCFRPRFEHCPVCPPGLLPDLAQSGAIVVTQPNLLFETGPTWLDQVPREQLSWLYPLKSFARHGIATALSSDSPLTPCDPLRGIHTAVTRKVEGGRTLSPEEGVSPLEALKMYTCFGAFSSLEERSKGSIAPGKLADLAVLNGDLTRVPPDEIGDIKVVATVIDGKVAWEGSCRDG